MTKIRYNKDVDALLIELSEEPIDYADEKGQLIVHFSKGEGPVLLEILHGRDFMLGSLSSLVKETEVVLP
ncbi:MAG: DUF2283 domain-containing protein [Dehalococcoidia bacterium]|nr:DUF2283 domain-containing protein [Dehalococcoidia bacterium]